jgi:hypothetical protein
LLEDEKKDAGSRNAGVEKDTGRRAVAPERTRRTPGRRLRSAPPPPNSSSIEAVLPRERRDVIRRRRTILEGRGGICSGTLSAAGSGAAEVVIAALGLPAR